MVDRLRRAPVDSALCARDLHVSLGGRAVLEGVDVTAERGRVLAVLGHNGAGKSTLLRSCLGLCPATRGQAFILGRASDELGPDELVRLAYVPETHAERTGAAVGEVVELRAALYPRFDHEKFNELAASFRLERAARVGTLSRGQRAGLVLSLALAQRPELLLLDDPTLGLDPPSRRRVLEAIVGFGREPEQAVVVASHDLADIERIADDVAIISSGRVIVASELTDLVESVFATTVRPALPARALDGLAGLLRIDVRQGETRLLVRQSDRGSLEEVARRAGVELTEPWTVSFEEVATSLLEAR